MKEWFAENRDTENARRRQWHADHREQANASRRARFLADYDQNIQKKRMQYQATRLSVPQLRLLANARVRAAAKSLEFSLTPEWLAATWTGKCELTGLDFKAVFGRRRSAFSPSLDRINPKRGYTPDNVRFILWGINAMKGEDTDADVLAIASAIVQNVERFQSLAGQ